MPNVLYLTWFVAIQVRCRDAAGKETCYAKGAVESVLERCAFVQTKQGFQAEMGEKERRRVLDAASALGMKGRRYVVMMASCCTSCPHQDMRDELVIPFELG